MINIDSELFEAIVVPLSEPIELFYNYSLSFFLY